MGRQTVRLLSMAEASAKRRGHGEDAIYFAAAKNRYVGAVSLGYMPEGKRIRPKVYGRTKQDVRDKLKALHQELEAGISPARRQAGFSQGSQPLPGVASARVQKPALGADDRCLGWATHR